MRVQEVTSRLRPEGEAGIGQEGGVVSGRACVRAPSAWSVWWGIRGRLTGGLWQSWKASQGKGQPWEGAQGWAGGWPREPGKAGSTEEGGAVPPVVLLVVPWGSPPWVGVAVGRRGTLCTLKHTILLYNESLQG